MPFLFSSSPSVRFQFYHGLVVLTTIVWWLSALAFDRLFTSFLFCFVLFCYVLFVSFLGCGGNEWNGQNDEKDGGKGKTQIRIVAREKGSFPKRQLAGLLRNDLTRPCISLLMN